MFVDQAATCFLHFWGREKQEKCLTTLMRIKDNTLDFFEKFNVRSELKSLEFAFFKVALEKCNIGSYTGFLGE